MYAVSNPLDVTIKGDALSRKLDQLMLANFAPMLAPPIHSQHEACAFCSHSLHHANGCPTGNQFSKISHEQVNAAFTRPGHDPYSNSYNPG